MLKLAPLRLPRVYEESLRLLSVLLQNAALRAVLEGEADSAVHEQLRERLALVDVTCLQELVLPGLYLPQTELLAAAVLSELNSSRCDLVAPTKVRAVRLQISLRTHDRTGAPRALAAQFRAVARRTPAAL